MDNPIYSLPEGTLVSGERLQLRFKIYAKNGTPFSLYGCRLDFALINYANKFGKPVLSKPCTARVGLEGVENVIAVDLATADTAGLYGKYIYQITIVDLFGDAEIPGQGVFFVTKNINGSIL